MYDNLRKRTLSPLPTHQKEGILKSKHRDLYVLSPLRVFILFHN